MGGGKAIVKKIQSIVIVGGGSSGWMTAALLSKVLFDVKIVLMESKNVPKIGVGEATTPPLTWFMRGLGFPSVSSWLSKCDGSIKTGVFFKNWYEKGDRYWHPFEAIDYISDDRHYVIDDRHHVGHCWLQLHRNGYGPFADRSSFYQSFFPTTALNVDSCRGPIVPTFAHHLDADLLGSLLAGICPQVERMTDDVLDVKLNEQGEISALVTADHGMVSADLFVDCTGFRRKLIRAVSPNQPFEPYGASLFCDRAVVVRVPYLSPSSKAHEMHPYVQADAQAAGWIWTIPLFSRISFGYVYSSNFHTESEAEALLRSYVGAERTQGTEARFVKFESGKLRNLWVKNCVAIGLSGSFIEPLESTGLYLTQTGIEFLAAMLDSRSYNDFAIERYNMSMQQVCTDIFHFIIAHYAFVNREDTPFWRAVKHETKIPEDLQQRLDLFKRLLPTKYTKTLLERWSFGDINWFAVLLGLNFPFDTPQLEHPLLEKALAIRDRKQEKVKALLASAPSHFEWLCTEVYGQQRAASSGNALPPDRSLGVVAEQ